MSISKLKDIAGKDKKCVAMTRPKFSKVQGLNKLKREIKRKLNGEKFTNSEFLVFGKEPNNTKKEIKLTILVYFFLIPIQLGDGLPNCSLIDYLMARL